MTQHEDIKRFVQGTLGCQCPPSVFEKIDYLQKDGNVWQKKITVGDRLLIYIVTPGKDSDMPGLVETALNQGIEEREASGLNRFRLVLASSQPDELMPAAEKIFNNLASGDTKAHLHVIHETEVSRW